MDIVGYLHKLLYSLNGNPLVIFLYLIGAYVAGKDIIIYLYSLLNKKNIKIRKYMYSNLNLEDIIFCCIDINEKLFVSLLNMDIDNFFNRVIKKSDLNSYIRLNLLLESYNNYKNSKKIKYHYIYYHLNMNMFIWIDYEILYKYRDCYGSDIELDNHMILSILKKFSSLNLLDIVKVTDNKALVNKSKHTDILISILKKFYRNYDKKFI